MKYLRNTFNKYPLISAVLLYLAFGLLLSAFTGCATQKRCNDKFPAEKFNYDSLGVIERVMIRDTIITTPSAVIRDTIKVVIDCDENGVGTIRPLIHTSQSGHVSQTLAAGGTYILTTCKADSLKTVIQRQQKQIESTRNRVSKESKPVVTNVIPGFFRFQNFVAITFEILLLVLAGALLRSVLKPKF